MKYGVCCPFDRADTVRKYNYSYIEPSLNYLAGLPDEKFAQAEKTLSGLGIRAEAFNCFFGGTMRFFGDEPKEKLLAEISEYVKRAGERAARLGGELLVLGSGGARKYPAEVGREAATDRFCEVLRICADAVSGYGIKIGIEPLNTKETNLVNSVSEAAVICRAMADSRIGITADFYHMYMADEAPETLAAFGDMIFHLHLARANEDRCMPIGEGDRTYLDRCIDSAAKAGYDGRLSLEGNFGGDFAATVGKMSALLGLTE